MVGIMPDTKVQYERRYGSLEKKKTQPWLGKSVWTCWISKLELDNECLVLLFYFFF